MPEARYPDDRSMFIRELPERDNHFAEAREEYLLNYGYNIRQHVDSNDQVLVVQSAGVGAWRGFTDDGHTWLMNNL